MARQVLTDVCPHCGMQVTFIVDSGDQRIKDLLDKYLAEKKQKEMEK